jgi:hypothetical protein
MRSIACLTLVFSLTALVLAPHPAQAQHPTDPGWPTLQRNLLANGSFESPNSSTSPVDWGYTYGEPLDPNPAFYRGRHIPGWRILKGTIDVKRSYWQHAPGQGHQSIDLVGSPGAASIEQTIATFPGLWYQFSGWVAHNPEIAYGRAEVRLNGHLFVYLQHDAPATKQNMQWSPFTYAFRATGWRTALQITDVTGLDPVRGTALDGLAVRLAGF